MNNAEKDTLSLAVLTAKGRFIKISTRLIRLVTSLLYECAIPACPDKPCHALSCPAKSGKNSVRVCACGPKYVGMCVFQKIF